MKYVVAFDASVACRRLSCRGMTASGGPLLSLTSSSELTPRLACAFPGFNLERVADREGDIDLVPERDNDTDLVSGTDVDPERDAEREGDTGLPLRDLLTEADDDGDRDTLRVLDDEGEEDGGGDMDRVLDGVAVRVAVTEREREIAAPTSTRKGV